MYYIGYDIGSSSIKAALVDVSTNQPVALTHYPEAEMDMISLQPGWAEQHPELWWEYVCKATKLLLARSGIQPGDVKGIGIAYQMHGLVVVNKNMQVLRPAIIWCDSRATEIGETAFRTLGEGKCLQHLLNSPGNFTAAKLRWIQENEPHIYKKIYKILLPGDFIALRMTGEASTTISGLSEGIFWDFSRNEVAGFLMEYMGFDQSIIPEIVPTLGIQGKLSADAAAQLGLTKGTMVGYRAGDQPNNALSLGVLSSGQVAATGGTSGVVYGVTDAPTFDPKSRANGFAHVNHTTGSPSIGILLCINGAGIMYRHIQQMMGSGMSYDDMEEVIGQVPIGSDQLRVLPFGNGAERILGNKNIGASFHHVQFNRHGKSHFFRAALEGIAFSFNYGINILKSMGMEVKHMKVGNDNLFRSATFSHTIATLAHTPIELVETTGAIGAARGAAFADGQFSSLAEVMSGDPIVKTYQPNTKDFNQYEEAYQRWSSDLMIHLNQ